MNIDDEIEKMMIRAKGILVGGNVDDVARAHVMIEWCRELRLALAMKKTKPAPFTEDAKIIEAAKGYI